MKRPDWIVRKVEALEDYRLRLFFENGDCRIFDMKPYLDEFPWRPLRNRALFALVHVAGDSVGWTEDIDMAPELLFEASSPEPCGAVL